MNISKLKKRYTYLIVCSLTGMGILLACGPYYAPRLLGNKNSIINTQQTGIALAFPNNKKTKDFKRELPSRLQATYDADLADLKKAQPNLPRDIFESYSTIRKDMILTAWNQSAKLLENERSIDWLDKATLAAIPQEFSLYLKAAVNYRKGKTNAARTQWKQLLTLPANQRHYRTIWAAWMLARTSTAEGEATKWYNKVKQLEKDGFPDSLQITDRDWTSFFSMKSGDYLTALDIYIKEGNEGKTTTAVTAKNIREALNGLLQDHNDNPEKAFKVYQELTKTNKRAIVASYHTRHVKLFIEALQASSLDDIDIPLGICAVKSYQKKDSETLKICLDAMKKPTTDSLWIQAKLAAVKGDLKEASTYYAKAVDSIKKEGVSPTTILDHYDFIQPNNTSVKHTRFFDIYSEYASVELGLKNYSKALDLFLTTSNHSDAAYIAETLLSPLELLVYYKKSETAQQSTFIKKLLARKLMRNEYFKDALTLTEEDKVKTHQQYITLYRTAINRKKPLKERVDSFKQAAQLAYDQGYKFLYLENHCRPFIRIKEANRSVHERYDYTSYYTHLSQQEFIPKMSQDELNRIKQHYIRISPVSTATRHAANLLYQAAILLPKNSTEAATLLWQAGDWTRSDPQVADKYYKALVNRCGSTALGRICDDRRWFITETERANIEQSITR